MQKPYEKEPLTIQIAKEYRERAEESIECNKQDVGKRRELKIELMKRSKN